MHAADFQEDQLAMLISTEELDTEDTGDWLIICSLCQKHYINSLYSQISVVRQHGCGEHYLEYIHNNQSLISSRMGSPRGCRGLASSGNSALS